MDDDVNHGEADFATARDILLEALAREEGWDLLWTAMRYEHDPKFKYAIDSVAMTMCCPTSSSIH